MQQLLIRQNELSNTLLEAYIVRNYVPLVLLWKAVVIGKVKLLTYIYILLMRPISANLS